jgi:hypothetical protein
VKQPDDEVELPEDQIRAVEDGSPPHHHGAFDDVAFLVAVGPQPAFLRNRGCS